MIIDLIIILILSILILYIIYKSNNIENFEGIISAIESNTQNIDTRKEVCNYVYNNPSYKPCNFKNITLTYFNPYFNSNQDYFLKDYFIASSYKSYQPCGNTRDVYSYDQIKKVLDYGARFINLDVYHNGLFELDDEAEPIVCNGDDTGPFIGDLSVPLKLNGCLNVIKENAWKKSNYPLLLYLNLNTQNNLFVEKKIKDAIIKNLGDRLVDKKYSYQNNVNPIGNASIKELLNKVIILISNKSNEKNLPNDPILYEITNGIIPIKENKNDDEKNNLTNEMINSYYLENYEYGGIKKFIYNVNDFIDKTKSHLTIIFVENKINENNIGESKIDLYNCIDFEQGFNVGVNIIPMNYQLITDDNETSNLKKSYTEPSMIRYQKFFQECSFIPKDFQCKNEEKTSEKYKTCIETLRIIPKPLHDFNRQDPILAYNKRECGLSEQPGFADYNC
jgi:hypothetical protein